MLVDGIRYDISPKKGSPQNWLNVMEQAQSLGFNKSTALVALDLRKFKEFFAPTILANFNKLLIFKGPVIPT